MRVKSSPARYDKHHYIRQMNYICKCIKHGVEYKQKEIMIDNFAGGGGASTGLEIGTGYSVYAAINHDPEAIKMHQINHPSAKHYCENVWDVNPLEVCDGYPVGVAWFSPDCKHFSKAKGRKPKDKKIRGLAWVALRWAGTVRPRVIFLENVEEFKDWGPLNRQRNPIKKKKGVTFQRFITQLKGLGYQVEYKELVAADFGAPTSRKRLFLVARCDGKPIVWPAPSHGPRNSDLVKQGILKPYQGAYTQIDFSRPCPSIFASAKEIKEQYGLTARRPLKPNTMNRIARGIEKFILNNPEPFILQCNHSGERRPGNIRDPLPVITSKHGYGIVEPYLVQLGQTGFTKDRSKDVREPLSTIVSKNEHCLIAPTLIQYHSERVAGEVRAQELKEPIFTVDAANRYALVSAFLQQIITEKPTVTGTLKKRKTADPLRTSHIVKMKGQNIGQEMTQPLQTITANGNHYGEISALLEPVQISFVSQMQGKSIGTDLLKPLNTMTGTNHHAETRAYLMKYYGQGTGQSLVEQLDTVTAQERFALIIIIGGIEYEIVDIGMRMLDPDELYGCQGFPPDYIIDRDNTGKSYPRTEQVKRCGNAVCPPLPAALVRANLPELCKGDRVPNLRIAEEPSGQLCFA